MLEPGSVVVFLLCVLSSTRQMLVRSQVGDQVSGHSSRSSEQEVEREQPVKLLVSRAEARPSCMPVQACSSISLSWSVEIHAPWICENIPDVPWWLCFKCCRKWSAYAQLVPPTQTVNSYSMLTLKNFFAWLHSPNLCTWFRCSARKSH